MGRFGCQERAKAEQKYRRTSGGGGGRGERLDLNFGVAEVLAGVDGLRAKLFFNSAHVVKLIVERESESER